MKEFPSLRVIKKVYGLLVMANNRNAIYVTELAKELSVKKTALVEFILANEGCFKRYQDKKGMYLLNVFNGAADNPETQEWLERQKHVWSHKLQVAQWDCYGTKEEYYLLDDSAKVDDFKYDNCPPYDRRYFLWRNTTEKMNKVKESGHFHKGVGSTGMWSGTTLPYCLTTDEMIALIDDGWTLMGEVPEEVKDYQGRHDLGL